MKFTVEGTFKSILDREMKILLEEKSKSLQDGSVCDLATKRLMEGYFLMKEYKDSISSNECRESLYKMEKEERERYQKLYEELKLKLQK